MNAAPAALTLSFVQSRPDAAARVLDALDTQVAAGFLGSVPTRIAAPLLERMQPDQAARAVGLQDPVLGAAMVRAMPHLDCVTVLRLVTDDQRAAIYAQLPTRIVREVSKSLLYPKETVGAWMEYTIPAFRATSQVSDALRYVRRNDRRPLAHVFVIGAGRRLQGAVAIANLVRVDESTPLTEILDERLAPLSNRALLSEAALLPAWDTFNTIPVVGRKGNVLGGLSRLNLRRGLEGIHDKRSSPAPVRLTSPMVEAWLIAVSGLFRALTGQRQV